MPYLDSHFHLDLFPEPARVLGALRDGGHHVIAVTNAPSVFAATAALVASTERIHAAVGMHPELIATHAHELPLMLQLLSQTRFVGEIGLDYVTTDETDKSQQRKVFAEIVNRCDQAGDKILTIHSRRHSK